MLLHNQEGCVDWLLGYRVALSNKENGKGFSERCLGVLTARC